MQKWKDVTRFEDGAIRFDLYGDTSESSSMVQKNFRRWKSQSMRQAWWFDCSTYYIEITYAGIRTIESPDYVINQPGQTLVSPTVINRMYG